MWGLRSVDAEFEDEWTDLDNESSDRERRLRSLECRKVNQLRFNSQDIAQDLITT